jgi:hypothetical protein
MRLEDCILDIDAVVMAPILRKDPEPDWVADRDARVIPADLFNIYVRAGYLSFGRGTQFLGDDKNVLFSYFGLALRSVKEALEEAAEEFDLLIKAQELVYDPGKRMRGEKWDPGANKQMRKHFKRLLVNLQASLDATADVIAMFFTGMIPGLRLGRAQFSHVETWLDRPLPATGLIVSPQTHLMGTLHSSLRPIVYPAAPEEDWLRLMRMFRNKSAHLGDPAALRIVGLHDEKAHFYQFLPRRWPFIWEEQFKPSDSKAPKDPAIIPKFLQDNLVHDDLVTYLSGLVRKVMALVDAAFAVMNRAYTDFAGFSPNVVALAELQGSSEMHRFERFHA